MYLEHFSKRASDDLMLKILKDGYLKPNSQTGELRMCETCDWIFTRINTGINKTENSYRTFIIDAKLLLENKFILHFGWQGCRNDNDVIIDGTKLNNEQLEELSVAFRDEAKRRYKEEMKVARKVFKEKMKKLGKVGYTLPDAPWTSNEILIKNNISLHKYLVDFLPYNSDWTKSIDYYNKHYHPQ